MDRATVDKIESNVKTLSNEIAQYFMGNFELDIDVVIDLTARIYELASGQSIRARLAAADEVAAQLARLEKHYIFGDEEYCDWCEAPPHADDCPFAVLTRGEGKTIEPALTAADALAAVLVLGNQAIKGAIQHVPSTVENHEWLALAAIVEERADAALRAYHEARGGE